MSFCLTTRLSTELHSPWAPVSGRCFATGELGALGLSGVGQPVIWDGFLGGWIFLSFSLTLPFSPVPGGCPGCLQSEEASLTGRGLILRSRFPAGPRGLHVAVGIDTNSNPRTILSFLSPVCPECWWRNFCYLNENPLETQH